jgi:hypothetical protein
MKKLLLIFCPVFLFSQSNYLSFAKLENGRYGIVQVTDETPNINHIFYDNGSPPLGNFVEVNSSIYDTTGNWGTPTLYNYHLTSEEFQVVEYFGGFESGFSTEFSIGSTLYGIRNHFFSGKALVAYNTNTNTDVEVFNFPSTVGSLHGLILVGNTLYGASSVGSSTTNSMMFSYNLETGEYEDVYTFNGVGTITDIIQHSNGNIYGATKWGGTNGLGYIFEYNTATESLTVLTNFTTNLASYNLVEGDNGFLYSFNKTTTSSGTGRISRFDLSTNSISNLHSFTTGVIPPNSIGQYYPLVYRDGILYGINSSNSGSSQVPETATLFTYNINSQIFDSNTIEISPNGSMWKYFSPLYKTSDSSILFTTSAGLTGKLMKIEYGSHIPTEVEGTEFGTSGLSPKKMIRTSDNLIYGICGCGGSYGYYDRLFSYNAETFDYNIKTYFQKEIGRCPTDIVQASNGKIFISTQYTNNFMSGTGTVYMYDPVSESTVLVKNFGGSFAADAVDELRLFEKNNIIYGVKGFNGNGQLYSGTIFSIDANTLEYTVLYESTEMANNPYTFLSSEGVLYGVAKYGGVNNEGYLYSFNTVNNELNVISDLDYFGSAYFTEAPHGDIYGTLQYTDGIDGAGSLFKINALDGSFSTLLGFPVEIDDKFLVTPTLIKMSGDFLYLIIMDYTPPPSASLTPILFSFDLNNSSTHYFNNTQLSNGLYLMNDDSIFGTNLSAGSYLDKLYSLEAGDDEVTTLFNSNSGISEWFNILDLNEPNLSINEFNDTTAIKIFPNPTEDLITITSSLTITNIDLFNLQGQKMDITLEEDKISLQDLSNGIYLLEIKTENNVFVKRIIKK